MTSHEFGIMPLAPKLHEQYNEYAPWKYNCIFIDDTLIERICYSFCHVQSSFAAEKHTLSDGCFSLNGVRPTTRYENIEVEYGHFTWTKRRKNCLTSRRRSTKTNWII